jgi:hypothetical protein
MMGANERGKAFLPPKFKVHIMAKYTKFFAALCFNLATLLGYAAPSHAQQNPVTAIDIALEPDATMIQRAQADDARLLKAFPKGLLWMQRTIRTSRCCSSSSARPTSKRSTTQSTRCWLMKSQQAGN